METKMQRFLRAPVLMQLAYLFITCLLITSTSCSY